MSKDDFIKKLLELQMEFQLAVHFDDYEEVELISKRIGRLVVRYLNDRKLYVEK